MATTDSVSSAKPARIQRPKASSTPFPVSTKSPFADGYDIVGERASLKDLVDADDLDTSDPRYSRYLELERREKLLKAMGLNHRLTGGAEQEVPFSEASRVQSLGKLTDDGEDSMTLHTRESSRLFIGRAKAPGEEGYGQSGGKKVGAALRAIWYLSESDNPYADFALIEAHGSIESNINELEASISSMEATLQKLKQRGLSFSVVRAQPPATVELGFRSPYGYSVVRLIATFDYFARVVKTLVRKDLMSDQEGYTEIFNRTRSCRRVFERVVWFQRYLMREELRTLSRADWLPAADAQGKKRVKAAVELFGELPREVFNGDVTPRHSRRSSDVSAEELRLLNELPLGGDEAVLEAAAVALE